MNDFDLDLCPDVRVEESHKPVNVETVIEDPRFLDERVAKYAMKRDSVVVCRSRKISN